MSKIMKQLEAEARAAREAAARKPTPEEEASRLPPLVEFEVWPPPLSTGYEFTVELRGGTHHGTRMLVNSTSHTITTVGGGGSAGWLTRQDYRFGGDYTPDGLQIWEAL